MNEKQLRELYNKRKGQCCKCGTSLYSDDAGVPLGSVFVLDVDGNYYCCNCDSDFDDVDDRIYDPA